MLNEMKWLEQVQSFFDADKPLDQGTYNDKPIEIGSNKLIEGEKDI